MFNWGFMKNMSLLELENIPCETESKTSNSCDDSCVRDPENNWIKFEQRDEDAWRIKSNKVI